MPFIVQQNPADVVIDFPTLEAQPVMPLAGSYLAGVARSTPQDGAVKTRKQFTRIPRTFSGVQLLGASAADFAAFEDFYLENAAAIFNWTRPDTGVVMSVRFAGEPKWQDRWVQESGEPATIAYDITFDLEEAT